MLGNILIGLLLLSLVVFVHESGHFIAARACGVDVLAFSIGFGPILFRKKIGETEYRLSLLPLGGYCSMRGEDAFSKALDKKLAEIPKEERSFYGVSKIRRIIIAFAGPLANYLFAVLGFTIVAAIGTSYYTSSNQIAPTYYYDTLLDSPAKKAGLKMGDRIIKIDGETTENFDAVYEKIALNPEKKMRFTIERDGSTFETEITPALNKDTGAGYVGFYAYIPLKIVSIIPNSHAEQIGFQANDCIVKINDTELLNTQDLVYFFKKNPDIKKADFSIVRNGETITLSGEVPHYTANEMPDFGFLIEGVKVTVAGKGFFGSIAEGFIHTNKTVGDVFHSLGLLFKGINFQSALAGPLGISNMLGESAKTGFALSFLQGIYNIAGFASLICISLFIMNLLPIPVLDGGIIFITLIEIIVRRPIHPKILYYIQLVGSFLILVLAAVALWADLNRLF